MLSKNKSHRVYKTEMVMLMVSGHNVFSVYPCSVTERHVKRGDGDAT